MGQIENVDKTQITFDIASNRTVVKTCEKVL